MARAKFVLRMWLTDDLIVKLVDPRSQFFRQKHEIMIDQGKELGIIWRDTQVWALTPRSYAKEVGIRPGMRLAKVDSLNIRSGGHLQGVIKRTESRSSDKDAKQAKLLFIANANLGWKIIDVDGAPVNTKDELYKRLEQAREEIRNVTAAKDNEQILIKLAKYFSPQVYESIFSGDLEVKIQTKRKRLTVFFSVSVARRGSFHHRLMGLGVPSE